MVSPAVALPFWEERWVAPYAAGAAQAGADVVAFPIHGARPPAAVLAACQGVLLIGGGDVAPARFGADDPHGLCCHVVPERDDYELELLDLALARDLPALAICRGHQVLAVARGGALHLDIPTELPGALQHSCPKEALDAHPVAFAAGSRLAAILGAGSISVNSRHHQAVRGDRVGDTLEVTARASDGVIEGLESAAHGFVVGVQWHPEDFVGAGDRFAPLFAAFVDRAAGGALATDLRSSA
ncbi:MAG: gamma-glutamyl-gamma-aminobutyrate hydrolase family protein [Deltaproteobacteria bacterium]|nr:gamma-glutamyl-gamma-aminobutyrate hydrolase family protein [Deltaproteobacteria bacterium]